jgi:DNA-binding transcriptional ArsR family regulator
LNARGIPGRAKIVCVLDTAPSPYAAKALAHPIRAAILERLYDREASPVELAREMGESLSHVAYHVRELEKVRAVALVRQRQVRGALEHTYTATARISLKQEPL